MGLLKAPPSREVHRVRLLILADARGPLHQQGKRFRSLPGSSPSIGDGLSGIKRLVPTLARNNGIEEHTLLVTTEVESGETHVTDSELFGC